jgi:hypothetical protein
MVGQKAEAQEASCASARGLCWWLVVERVLARPRSSSAGGAEWLAPVGDGLLGFEEVSGTFYGGGRRMDGMDGWKGAGLGERSEGRAGCEGRCRKGKPEKYGRQGASINVNESTRVRDRAEPQ